MTTLDDIPFQPDDDWPPAVVVEREPRKCRHPRDRRIDVHRVLDAPGNLYHVIQEHPYDTTERCEAAKVCGSCFQLLDSTRARRGKTSRNRGNAYEREVAAILGGRRVGQYGDQVDVEVPDWLRVQCKNGGAYPALLDRWLRAIPVQADLLRAVVIGDAPGPGTRRRSLIVLDLGEFASWYAGAKR